MLKSSPLVQVAYMRYAGAMGTSIAAGLLAPRDNTVKIRRVIATVGTEASKRRVEETLAQGSSKLTVLLQSQNLQAVEEADVVIMSVKPSKRGSVFAAKGVREALRGKLVISIMAGVPTANLHREICGEEPQVSGAERPGQFIRVMPNMAAKIREATTLLTGNMETLTQESRDIATWVFDQVGQTGWIAESTADISAVLVGCAGSLMLVAVDGLLDAAVAEGVSRREAEKFVTGGTLGMMKLVESGEHPSVLREKISSPGGCSIRAVLELERRAVRSAYCDAIMQAADRSRFLSKL